MEYTLISNAYHSLPDLLKPYFRETLYRDRGLMSASQRQAFNLWCEDNNE